MDIWSLGCIVAEMWFSLRTTWRGALFQPAAGAVSALLGSHNLGPSCLGLGAANLSAIVNQQFSMLATPTHEWWSALPFWKLFRPVQQQTAPAWPPPQLLGAPKSLADFVHKALRLHPEDRISAASVGDHPFVRPRVLSCSLSRIRGKYGSGTIIKGKLQSEVVRYLQKSAAWDDYYAEAFRRN